jgi:cyclopropane fatty-acyl-phospholipid synthase-like methyltransferase
MFKSLGKQLRQPSGSLGILVSRMMEMKNREYYRKIIKELNVQRGEKIFEIGYGPGFGISLVAKNEPDCLISGIDFSVLMFKRASKRNRKFIDRGTVSLKYGNFLTADLEKEQYDKIFCLNVIYFWSDLGLSFGKVHSLLKSGGSYFIFMIPVEEIKNLKFMEDFCKYPVENVESELKIAGFSEVEYKLDKGYYIRAKK